MFRSSESHKMNIYLKGGLFLALGLLVTIVWQVGAVYALANQRVDVPNPKVEPLVDSDTDVANITSLVADYLGPGSYEVAIEADGKLSISNRWCARTEEILAQNLEQIYFAFEVNGRDVLSRLHTYEDVDYDENGDEMYCHGYRGLLSEWPSGNHKIYYDIYFEDTINDGWSDYPAGEITWEYALIVLNAEDGNGGVPLVTVSVNTNCRLGPGKAYEIVSALRVEETAEVVGKNPDSDYWIIFEPNIGRECWLWGFYADVTGDIDQLKVYTPPPLPTPTPTPSPATRYSVCYCNNTGDYISSIQLFNDDTDEWMGEFGSDGFPPGFCTCNCNSMGEPYPTGDYVITYKLCNDGAACQVYGASHTQGFENYSGNQMFEINP